MKACRIRTLKADHRAMLAKLVAADLGNRLVTEIAAYDVEKLLNNVAAGPCQPHRRSVAPPPSPHDQLRVSAVGAGQDPIGFRRLRALV